MCSEDICPGCIEKQKEMDKLVAEHERLKAKLIMLSIIYDMQKRGLIPVKSALDELMIDEDDELYELFFVK
jgi:peroxiredoxin